MSKNNLCKDLQKVINKTINAYITAVSEKYQLESSELQQLWTEVQGRKKQGKPRQNGYINFCKMERSKLKKNKPDMSFGEQGKELGRMWKELSVEEQKKWNEKVIA